MKRKIQISTFLSLAILVAGTGILFSCQKNSYSKEEIADKASLTRVGISREATELSPSNGEYDGFFKEGFWPDNSVFSSDKRIVLKEN